VRRIERIVVGADGSGGAANAMRWASRLASAHEAELIVMTGLVPTDWELPPQRVEALLAERQSRLDEWSEAAKCGDVAVRTVVERGDPRPGILKVSQREEADLIVVGRVGTSVGPGLLHIGSVAEWLCHNADRPVAVVGGAVNATTRSVIIGVDGSEPSKAALDWVANLGQRADLRVVAATVRQPYVEWTPSDSPENWRRDVEDQIRDKWAGILTAAGIDFKAVALRGSNLRGPT
jgi:nucleotide-binding universal stress UspA family protein